MTLNPIFHIKMVEGEVKDTKKSNPQSQRGADEWSAYQETNPTKDQSNGWGLQNSTSSCVHRSKCEDTLAEHQPCIMSAKQKQYSLLRDVLRDYMESGLPPSALPPDPEPQAQIVGQSEEMEVRAWVLAARRREERAA